MCMSFSYLNGKATSSAISLYLMFAFPAMHRSLNVYSGVKGYPELQCLSITSVLGSLESINMSPGYYGYQVPSRTPCCPFSFPFYPWSKDLKLAGMGSLDLKIISNPAIIYSKEYRRRSMLSRTPRLGMLLFGHLCSTSVMMHIESD